MPISETTRLRRAALRQTVFGSVAVAVTWPAMLAVHRAFHVGMPPVNALLLLGASVLVSFSVGGLIGAGLAQKVRPGRWLRPAAALLGLVWGLALCSLVLPWYTDQVMEQLTDSGTEQAVAKIGTVAANLNSAPNQLWDVAGKLTEEGAAQIPALLLLGWTLIGPALAAPWEARIALNNQRRIKK